MDQKYVTWNTNGTNTLTRPILLSKVLDDVHNFPIVQKRIAKYLDDSESHFSVLDRNVFGILDGWQRTRSQKSLLHA